MTHPNSSENTPKRTNRLRWVLWTLLFILVMVVFILALMLTTTVGARLALGLLGNYAGLRAQGVSGSLIHQLQIDHLEMRHPDLNFVADDVELQWQPSALFFRRIQLDYARIDNMQLTLKPDDGTPMTLPNSLQLSGIDKLSANELVVQHLQLSTSESNENQDENPLQFSALKAKLAIDSTRYQLQFSGATPWGSADIEGSFETKSPFRTQAQFSWRGLDYTQNGVTLPATQARGTLTGNWRRLLFEAKLGVDSTDQESEPASGYVKAVLTPFNHLPIETLQMDLDSVDPASFYVAAPTGDLQIKANFKLVEEKKSPTLQGKLTIHNTLPMTWDLGGIPVVKLSAELNANLHQISWQAMKMELEEGGLVTGSGLLDLTPLSRFTTTANLKNINLLRIDNRLKQTKLNGKIDAKSTETGLQFALNLKDDDPKNLNANLTADAQLTHDQVLNLKKVELRAKDASLTAQGKIALRDKQEFSLQGEARNLNPAHWLAISEGRIATRFNVTGQLQQGWKIDAQVRELSGQFAGLNLQGESDVIAQQDKFISVKKLELNWGKNHLSAKGNWSLAGAAQHEQLRFNLALPELRALSDPFKKLMPAITKDKFQGALFIDGMLSGNMKQPAGQFNVKADKLAIPSVIELEKLQATFALESGKQGKMEGNLDATGVFIDGFDITRLQGNLSGLRHAHQLQMNATLPRKYQVTVQAKGDLQEPKNGSKGGTKWQAQWHGLIQQFNLSGPSDLQLASPFNLQISGSAVQMSPANWQGKLGKLQIQQLDWSRGQFKTKGQLQDLLVANAIRLWRGRLPVMGDLQVNAGWDFVVGRDARGQFDVKRTSGDLSVQDISGGYSQTFALGLQNLSITGRVGQSGTSTSRAPVDVQMNVSGTQLGQIEANVRSAINRTAQGWRTTSNTPLSGSARLQTNDIQWLGQLIGSGNSGMALRGQLRAQAELSGTMERPIYSAQINGKELQVAFAELGVLLPNGVLDARIDANLQSTEFKLNKLQFSQTIKAPQVNQRRQDQLVDFSKLGLLNETGYAQASGTIDLRSGRGSISAQWQRFPFLQTEEGWLVASGDAQLTETEKSWNLIGQSIADAAYFSVPKQPPPKLSNDVVVIKKNNRGGVASAEKAAGVQSSVDFLIKTGNNFVFVGRGLNTRLSGDIRIRIQNDGPVLATGSIYTTGGTYEGYGQQLAIERGILNFQGPLDNPTMNVRALRRNLPVEAGVEVVGTVAKPEVRLISEPNVPDQDKLSWMILGHGADQSGGSEAGLLMTAASAILGRDSDSNLPRDIARTFGLDDFSLSTSSTSPDSQLPSQTVAGSISNGATTDQVFTVGKRLTPDLVFSVERSLTDATNGVKLTWKLTRRFSVIGRAGTDTSIDGQYLFSFN